MLRTEPDILSQPHGQATLSEHFELGLKLARHQSPLTSEILRFFECDDVDLTMATLRLPEWELPNIHRGIRRRLLHWRLIFEGGKAYGNYQPVWAPTHRRVKIRPGKFQDYLSEGSAFYELASGSRRVMILDRDYDPPEVELTVVAPRAESRQLRREMSALSRWMKRHHYLRGQSLRADATLLDDACCDWNDVALDPAVREALRRNIEGILRQREVFKKNNVPLKRGILLHGPPGTGKTMVGKVLAGLADFTFLWITAADCASVQTLRGIFGLARQLNPSIIFLEDLDLYAGERYGTSLTLGELLSQMDGLENNDGLIIVATTNDLMAIEPALRDRPSRFDVVLEVGLPKTAARREILARLLDRHATDDALLDRAAAASDGLSGAQLREVACRAIQEAIFRGAVDSDGVAQPELSDMLAAIEAIGGSRRTPIGF